MKSKEDCIHCGLCRKHCSFLEKYKLDIGQIEEREDLIFITVFSVENVRKCVPKI